jgi:small subunit ribosomal protein S17
MVGTVVSDKMAKTAIVAVKERRTHSLYGKVVTATRRFKAHNEKLAAQLGDIVRITESRPLSREKHWVISEIVQHRQVVEAVRDREIEELLEAERAAREARKEEERRRHAERLARLAGEGEEGEAEVSETGEAGEAPVAESAEGASE